MFSFSSVHMLSLYLFGSSSESGYSSLLIVCCSIIRLMKMSITKKSIHSLILLALILFVGTMASAAYRLYRSNVRLYEDLGSSIADIIAVNIDAEMMEELLENVDEAAEFIYQEYEPKLEPGTALFLYTDGLPEAADKDYETFGNERIMESLNNCEDRDPHRILEHISMRVDDFVGDVEPFDDLTILCINCFGPEKG